MIRFYNISSKWKEIAHQVITFLFILLFTYASASKLMDFEEFKSEIEKSPLLIPYSESVAVGVPLLELTISGFLLFSITRFLGLYLALSLMTSFTVYIFLVLNYTDYVPCSCGGILEELGWTEHLIFNLIFVVIASVGIILSDPPEKNLKILMRNK